MTVTDWRPKAACLGLPTTAIFFDDAVHRYRDARPICESCPVQLECLKSAIEEEAMDTTAILDGAELTMRVRVLSGFRGNRTPKERRPMVADFLRNMKRMRPNDGEWRRPKHPASCHPDKNRYRRDLCQRCYVKVLAKEHANA